MTRPIHLPFTLADITAYFGAHEIKKAQPYIRNAVRLLHVENSYINAEVQGTARTPYDVHINFYHDTGDKVFFYAECSCPVGYQCKHAAATLIAALNYRHAIPGVPPETLAWLDQWQQSTTNAARAMKEVLVYLLKPASGKDLLAKVFLYKVRVGKEGLILESANAWSNIDGALRKPPLFIQQADRSILHLISDQALAYGFNGFLLENELNEMALDLMRDTGRLYIEESHTPLKRGADRAAHLQWRREGSTLRPELLVEPAAKLFALSAFWYLDARTGELGRVNTTEDPGRIKRLLSIPPVTEQALPLVATVLAESAPDLAPPIQSEAAAIDIAPKPVLSLHTLAVRRINPYRSYGGVLNGFDVAEFAFDYDGMRVGPDDRTGLSQNAEGQWIYIKRQADEEARWTRQLRKYGLIRIPASVLDDARVLYGLENEAAWVEFMTEALPKLRAAGWLVEIPDDFRHLWHEPEGWDATVNEDGSGWFDLDLGVLIDGQRLALTPMLSELFAREPRWLDSSFIDEQADDASVILHSHENLRIRVEAGRIKTIVRQLIDLFDRPQGEGLRLHTLDATRLAALPEDMRPNGSIHALEVARRIQSAGVPVAVEPPEGLGLELRGYQREGLGWLSHLRTLGVGGILADDMGLGKTAQTLAFLLREKQQGRLTHPALIVLPTSLLFNWRHEAEHITPALRVLTLHGANRSALFDQIATHDIVLSTYPLVWRDIEILEQHTWSQLILDEAQTVKNASSQAAQAIRRIKSEHRLSLTGTPMENHLGELWAQFDFLLPGFLGDKTAFTRAFRTPIEKHGDTIRRDLLARRLRPFLLRRRKEDVAAELPPKTSIIRSVSLEGAQRDLYETVRSAMDEKVRQSIDSMGLARSHIVILDALLKLRQVCCDPRLLPSRQTRKSGKHAAQSAKLDLLLTMLPELVDEGRRILVFSQFTSMLALISEALTKAKLAHTILTGETRDRETVVRQFQNGDIPIFLISLKAGGVGLNLTAADTVIHYDPWWNPAVEDQATDRAHRIGQTRQVFVYKLVAEGSIEEKILALQDKKAKLAEGVLSGDGSALTKFSEADIQALMAPLPSD